MPRRFYRFQDINIGALVAVFMVFVYLFVENMRIDNDNYLRLEHIPSHKEVPVPDISDADRLVIEKVMNDYWEKRKMNKSNCSRISTSIKDGVLAGAVSGAVLGSGITPILTSSIISGSISGLLKSYSLRSGTGTKYLIQSKPT